jgi:Protein of unknown function (DUF2934)
MHNRASQRAELDQKQRGPQAADRSPAGSQAEKPNSAELGQRIRQRAYELYVAGGCKDGHADEDWRLAEEEILGITGGG